MTEHDDGPPVCELCDGHILDDTDVTEDRDGHPVHATCLRDEMEQLAAEKAAVQSGRGDLERW